MMATPWTHIGIGEGEEYEARPDAERLYDHRVDGDVVGWRQKAFFALGFNAITATALAIRRDVDREYVSNLIAAGATPEQVMEIVL